jgi:hypothetical protein
MISYGGYEGAAGARRPPAGCGDLLTYYFSFSQPIFNVSSFNMTALSRLSTTNFDKLSWSLTSSSRQLRENFRDHQQDNIIINKLRESRKQNQLNFLDIINKKTRSSTSSSRQLQQTSWNFIASASWLLWGFPVFFIHYNFTPLEHHF